MVLRENIRNLSPECLRKLREAFRKMQDRIDNRSFGYIAGLHGWPGERCQHGPRPDDRGNPVHLFLPWHRAYLYHFEKLLQAAAQDNEIGIPWWNWRTRVSASEGMPKALSEEVVNNVPNPLFKYHMNFTVRDSSGQEIRVNRDTVRYPGPPNIPSLRDAPAFFHSQQADIPDLYRLSDFNQFSERLRLSWHNYIHGWVGGYISSQERGDMALVQTAAYDPIFWFHHCNVDRVWAIWQTRQGIDNVPSYMKDIVLRPFGMTVREVLSINSLDYEYASSVNITSGE